MGEDGGGGAEHYRPGGGRPEEALRRGNSGRPKSRTKIKERTSVDEVVAVVHTSLDHVGALPTGTGPLLRCRGGG